LPEVRGADLCLQVQCAARRILGALSALRGSRYAFEARDHDSRSARAAKEAAPLTAALFNQDIIDLANRVLLGRHAAMAQA
jgi:hypothetical protein